MGVAQALKAVSAAVRIVALEPAEAPFMSEGRLGPHKIQGIGCGFLPPIVDMSVIDEIISVASDDAIEMAKTLAREHGLLVGVSSGANVLAAIEVANTLGPGKKVVTILVDRAERYGSLGLL